MFVNCLVLLDRKRKNVKRQNRKISSVHSYFPDLVINIVVFYATLLRDLAPKGEVSMLASLQDIGLVVFACSREPENWC